MLYSKSVMWYNEIILSLLLNLLWNSFPENLDLLETNIYYMHTIGTVLHDLFEITKK
jgi:hypothetical protein